MRSKIMELESPSIQLKVMSCTDLKAFNFFHKLSIYVVVSILHHDPHNNKKQMLLQRQKTPIDRDGDRRPEWNHLMHFDLKPIVSLLDSTHVFIKFHLRCQGIIYGNKTIGEVCVPLEDLIQESTSSSGGGAVKFVSYQVRTTDGKPNGVLNFCYKVIGNGPDTKTSGTRSDPRPPVVESFMTETERVHYPSLEDIYDYPPLRDIWYPSVDVDVYCPSPSPGLNSFPSQQPKFHCTTPPPPPPPPVVAGALYYSPPPGPYKYALESGGYDSVRVGQVERVDGESWRLPTAGGAFPAFWTAR